MEDTNEGAAEAQAEVDTAAADVEALEADTEDVQDTTDWKAKYEEAEGRRKRAETKLQKTTIDRKVEEKLQAKAGELDETQLDYLDLKGITEADDLKVIESVMQKTGLTVRQALKDDYVMRKLESNKAAREVKEATPSSTKRTGSGQSNDLNLAVSKFEATGKLPDDFKLRLAVVKTLAEKTSNNKPSWH